MRFYIWEHHKDYIYDKFTKTKYYYNNSEDMNYIVDYMNHITDDNHNLSDNYKDTMATKNIIAEKLRDYQRISNKYELISSTELEWLLDKVYQDRPEYTKQINEKHMKSWMESEYRI